MRRCVMVLLGILALACSGPTGPERSEGTEPGDCEDGVDNDDDGQIDCDDSSCVGIPICDEVDGGLDAGPPDAGPSDSGTSDGGSDTGAMDAEVFCAADERVASNACVACEAGTTNAAGDDAAGADTTCDATLCAVNQRVASNACVACDAGTTNAAGDDASGTDTTCDTTLCAVNQRVASNACVACASDTTNAAGDDASGPDTLCDITPLVFDLRDRTFTYTEGLIEDLDEASTFSITLGGVTATLTANQGELNQTASGFGVNSPLGADDSARIDGDAGVETVTITFGVDVVFRGLDLSAFSGTDAATMTIAAGAPNAVTNSGFVDAGSVSVTAGQAVVIAYVAGNGFSLDAIQINPP